MNTTRPESSTVALWDDLDKLALDYRRLVNRCQKWNTTVIDRKFIERTAEQLEATRNKISAGTIEQATAIAVMQAAERILPLARDLVRARTDHPMRHAIDPDRPIPYMLTCPPPLTLITRDEPAVDEVPC
jgi:hypothetical protein